MTRTRTMKFKGFTLIEMIVVVAIIGALALIIVPTMSSHIKEAKRTAAIADARTVKQAVEFSLVNNLPRFPDAGPAFNKVLYYDQNKNKKMSDRNYEIVGSFTNVSWVAYRNKKLGSTGSQAIDQVVASSLDNAFSESWKTGISKNPMKYKTVNMNCQKYLEENKTNFGLIVVYDTMGSVRMMQLYRKGVLVTYINNEYLVNTSPNAHFVGEGTWDTIYAESGSEAPEEYCRINLANGQFNDKGEFKTWY